MEEDKYLQLYGFSIEKNPELARDELLQYITRRFKGYEFYFGFLRQNARPLTVVMERNDEIFRLSYRNNEFTDTVYRALVGQVLNLPNFLVNFFNDKGSQKNAVPMGFNFIGKSMLYYLKNSTELDYQGK